MMNEGRITNFTLEGKAIRLTAFLKDGKTAYNLNLAFVGDDMSYKEFLSEMTLLKQDMDAMLELQQKFKEEEDGALAVDEHNRLIPDGMTLDNELIQTFEETWNHADQ